MITATFETAKKLKEARWNKPTYFFYGRAFPDIEFGELFSNIKTFGGDFSCYAPTLQEILEELPSHTEILKFEGKYNVGIPYITELNYTHESPVEAAAQLWIILNKK